MAFPATLMPQVLCEFGQCVVEYHQVQVLAAMVGRTWYEVAGYGLTHVSNLHAQHVTVLVMTTALKTELRLLRGARPTTVLCTCHPANEAAGR